MKQFSNEEKAAWHTIRAAYAERLVKERAVRSTTPEEVGEVKALMNATNYATRDIKRLIAAMNTAGCTIVSLTQERLDI